MSTFLLTVLAVSLVLVIANIFLMCVPPPRMLESQGGPETYAEQEELDR